MFEAILASCRDGLERTISQSRFEGLTSEDLAGRFRLLTQMVDGSGKLGRDLIFDDQVPVQIAELTVTWAARAFPTNISEDQRNHFWQELVLRAYTQILATAVVWRKMGAENQIYNAVSESDAG